MIAAYIFALMIWAQEPSQPPYFTAWTVDMLRHEMVRTVADTRLGPTPAPEPVDVPAIIVSDQLPCEPQDITPGVPCTFIKERWSCADRSQILLPKAEDGKHWCHKPQIEPEPAMHCGPALVWPTDDLSDEAGQKVRICFMEEK